MVYNGDLVRINGNVIPKVKKYAIGRSKLWQNAERNMNGSVSAYLTKEGSTLNIAERALYSRL